VVARVEAGQRPALTRSSTQRARTGGSHPDIHAVTDDVWEGIHAAQRARAVAFVQAAEPLLAQERERDIVVSARSPVVDVGGSSPLRGS